MGPRSRALSPWISLVSWGGALVGEGLATYYEPIVRARAGFISAAQLRTLFAHEMRRGLPSRGSTAGLAERDDVDSVYWGGALFALLADVALRQRPGAHSLDEVLRGTLAQGGDATRVWTVADVIRRGDETTHTEVLRDLHARHALRSAIRSIWTRSSGRSASSYGERA